MGSALHRLITQRQKHSQRWLFGVNRIQQDPPELNADGTAAGMTDKPPALLAPVADAAADGWSEMGTSRLGAPVAASVDIPCLNAMLIPHPCSLCSVKPRRPAAEARLLRFLPTSACGSDWCPVPALGARSLAEAAAIG